MAKQGLTIPQNKAVRLLALGDSYTIGESVAEDQRWPVQFAGALRERGYTCHDPDIIAATGWRTDDLRKAIDAAGLTKSYDLVALLIGVNNQYQGKSLDEYAIQFEDLVKTAIGYAGGDVSKVFILSIPDYGFTPFGEPKQREISAQINAFNRANHAIAKTLGVHYADITDISRRGPEDPALVAEDGLHPSGRMYALWVERILETLFFDD